MKNRILRLIILCLCIISSISQISFGTENDIGETTPENSENIILIGGDNDYPPYEFIDQSGNYRGFNVDIISAIADEMDIEIQLVPLPWNLAVESLENGSVDLIQGMTISDKRLEMFSFTEKTVTNSQSIFVRASTTYVSDLIDLSGEKVSYQKGDVNFENLDRYNNLKLIEYENQKQAIKALLEGQSVAFLGNRQTGLYNLQKMGKLNEVKIVGEPIKETEYAIACKKGNEDVIKVFNEGLQKIKDNGKYDMIYKKWFGESFYDNSDKLMKYLIGVLIVLFIVLVIVQIVILINKRLKDEVNKRTKELTDKQNELEKADREKSNIIEAISSGLIAFDNKLEITFFNMQSKEILEKEISKKMSWYNLGLEEFGIEGLEEAIEGSVYRKSISWTKNNSETRYVDYTISPITGPESTEGVILMLHDYTNEKILQDIISHDDKITTLGRLLAGITHEIKNPLASIKGYLEQLPAKKDDSEFIVLFQTVVEEEINRLSNMVSNVLDFSKNGKTQVQNVSIEEIIRDITILFKVKMVEKRANFNWDIKNCYVRADMQQIKQILINIILNSLEALDDDGTGSITVKGYEENDKVIIKIIDNGCGIPDELLNKVFDPFFTSKEEGYGVGLYITNQLVISNEGSIKFDSAEDEGTTVTLTFNKN